MIALVWNSPIALGDISIRYELYAQGLLAMGEDSLTICLKGCEPGYPYPVRTVDGEGVLHDSAFWQDTGCRAVVVITWHRMTGILRAIQNAGLPTVAIGDSDARCSPRFHPWPTLRFMTYLQPTWKGKLAAAKHWLQRYLFQAAVEHRALIENTAASDVLTLADRGAVDEFRRVLVSLGSPELAERVGWLPYPVPESFCCGDVNSERPRRVIAIGRWDSTQKNPGLLAATIQRLSWAGDRTEIIIVGRGAEERFAGVARRRSQVQVLGIQPRERIRELMGSCRAVLVPSRWEGAPIVANEMLTLGGTVVGTPIPSLQSLTADGQFGRVSRTHSSGALAKEIMAEMDTWDVGKRVPREISDHWRGLVSPTVVARRVVEFIDSRDLPSRVAGPELSL